LAVSLTENGAAFDTNGSSAVAQIRKTYDGPLIASFTVTFGTPTSSGAMALTMSAVTSSSLSPGNYLYDVLLTKSTGYKIRALEGTVTVTPAITVA
jgi:hypothetical protein